MMGETTASPAFAALMMATAGNQDRMTVTAARETTLAFLAARSPAATVCPSEVARVLAPETWREAMPAVHAAIDQLLTERQVSLSWKGKALPTRAGPYRIGHQRIPVDAQPGSPAA